MSVDIKLKHSAVAGKKPDPGQLQNGELALNTKDVKAYIKDSDGNVVQIAGKDMPDNDSRYVQVTGDNMTGDLTLGTDKITLGVDGAITAAGSVANGTFDTGNAKGKGNTFSLAGGVYAQCSTDDSSTRPVFNGIYGTDINTTITAAGNATFAGDVRIKSYVDAGATAYNNTAIFGSNNDNSNATLVVQNYSTNGDIFVGRSSSSDKVVEISNSGSAEFAGNVVVNSYISGYRQTQDDAASLITLHSDNGNPGVKSAKFTVTSDGSAEFAGDVAIGDSTTFLGTIGDALALLPNSIVDQFKTVIDGLPKAQPYGATTLPADLPTPLKDALVRVTTAGKINLNSDGSASFAGTVQVGGNPFPATETGASIYNDGSIALSSASSDGVILFGYTTGNTTPTTLIKADGSASFAGTVNCIEDDIVPLRIGSFSATDNLEVGLRIMGVFDGGGGIADLYQDRDGLRIGVGTTTNNTRVDGNILIDRDHNLKIGGTLPASPNITLNADGSASFAGNTQIGEYVFGNGKFGCYIYADGSYHTNNSTGTKSVFKGHLNEVPTSEITADGSASFAGSVDVGGSNVYLDKNGQGRFKGRLRVDSYIESFRDSSGESVFSGYEGSALNVDITAGGTATFTGNITAANVTFNLEPDNDANYTTTTEEYTETEYYTVEVPVVERPGTGTADIQDGVGTADLVDGDERQTQTITKSREVTKTREVKTYTGPTLDVKEKLLAYEERFKQQDAVIAQMTTLLKGLGADVSTLPALEGVTKKKKR